MALIDHTFFVGEINIPNTSDTDIKERLTYFIEIKQEKLLQDILGYVLWKAFDVGIGAGGPDQKWIDIRDGKEYTGLDGYPHKWIGLKSSYTSGSVTIKKSLIANYVYWHWQADNVTHSTGVGEASAKAENAVIASPKAKMIAAWNQMIDWICDLIYFLDSNIETYPDWEQRNNYFQMRKYRKQNIYDI